MDIRLIFDVSPGLAELVRGAIETLKERRASAPAEAPHAALFDPEPIITPADTENAPRRKPRAKKAVDPAPTPDAAPAIEAAPAPEVDPATEAAPVPEVDPAIEAAPAPDAAPATDATTAPEAVPEHPRGDAGKGGSGDALAELTKLAVEDLDAQGIDRVDSNRRIRDYCAAHGLKFPTFPALLKEVGYATAIAICKGEEK